MSKVRVLVGTRKGAFILTSTTRQMSFHSGSHCSSCRQTYGRWKRGTRKCCGRLNNSSGVLLKVSTLLQIPSDASGAAVGWWAVALLNAWVT